jgi:hypothetical protein
MAGGIIDNLFTYDLLAINGGPRKPNLYDLGGDEMVDDDPAPKKFEQVCAAWANSTNRTLAALTRINGSVKVWVEFVALEPIVTKVSAMGTLITNASITVTVVATGEVELEWAANTLPPMECEPISWLNDGPGAIHAKRDGTNQNKVLVFIYGSSWAGANLNFGVEIG